MEKNGDCIGSLRYQYSLADHLGNTRVVYTENNGEAELLQEGAYYPFGMRIPSMSKSYSGSSDDRYLYNGKELEGRLSGFHFYDYGARFYDAALGRFHSVDPLTETYASQSQYVYAANNPILFIDKDGMGPWPGVTFTYAETDIGAGIGYGSNFIFQSGVARDEVGKTHFTAKSELLTNPSDFRHPSLTG